MVVTVYHTGRSPHSPVRGFGVVPELENANLPPRADDARPDIEKIRIRFDD